MTVWLKSVIVAAAILAELVPGNATTASRFNGSCRFFGSGSYERPSGFMPKHVNWSIEGTGICSGKLNGKVVTGSVSFSETLVDQLGGCVSSYARGWGSLRFTNPPGTLDYKVMHVSLQRRMQGRTGGIAVGFLTAFVAPPPQGSPAQALGQCASGKLRDFNFEMDFATLGAIKG